MIRDSASMLARCIDAVRLHRTQYQIREGVAGFVKARRRGTRVFYGPGNFFLRLSGSGIQMFGDLSEWQRHEISSFRLCHPNHKAEVAGKRSVFLEALPGKTLRDLDRTGSLTHQAIQAAAVELRRAHSLCDPLNEGRAWSHGDPHLGNFLYDSERRRCHLIDFETAHLQSIDTAWRQADDLLTVCLELLGSRKDGAEFASIFLASYGSGSTLQKLSSRLQRPKGFQRILWSSRSKHLPFGELCAGISDLRGFIEGIS